nr:Rieske (2Fe-2S) protein [Kineosphaera limosa]
MSAIAAAVQKGEPAVGEAKFFPDAHIVLTQPTEGSFVALSSTCTHEGVTINRFSDGQLVCPAHGSRFDPATGEATRGPAQAALPKRTVSKTGNTVTLS